MQAKQIQTDSAGLKFREVEQAVITTFLHSQPLGQSAKSRDLIVLLGSTRPDKIELEKGLTRWAQLSYWLDDLHTGLPDGKLPQTWRLGNRPNLTQMHDVARKNIQDDIVRARLLDDISKTRALTANASAAGVSVHTLPARPNDIKDDGAFRYAVLGPNAASESGKPSPEARRFLDETTGPDKPRVYRNSVLLLVPSKDGLELAMASVRDSLAWEIVQEEIKKQQADGNVDPARAQTLRINIDKAKGRVPESIRQAYCIVVTVSEKDDAQAFKITVTDEPHFNVIKNDKRSRIQDTAITAEALLPDGPYNLWRAGETSRRVKDLAGAFAQYPHLPKMLKASAILETLAGGCENGTFVLRLVRPDRTSRTWWMSRPDENALNDPALELVLPEGAEIAEVAPSLLAPGRLSDLWSGDEITAKAVADYFSGSTVVQIERDGYKEPLQIPKATQSVIDATIGSAVESGILWLLSGPASVLGEPIPAGVLNPSAVLRSPPDPIGAPEILAENLPHAWTDGSATGLSISTALSVKAGRTLPWKTVRDVTTAAINARFIELTQGSQPWPNDLSAAQFVKFKAVTGARERDRRERDERVSGILQATAELSSSQIQDLGDVVDKLTQIKAKTNTPIKFFVRIEVGDGQAKTSDQVKKDINAILKGVKDNLEVR
jgi:hypothetical protein